MNLKGLGLALPLSGLFSKPTIAMIATLVLPY
jgi:hypothetical protein